MRPEVVQTMRTGLCGHCKLHTSFRLFDIRRLVPSMVKDSILSTSGVTVLERSWTCQHCNQGTIEVITHRLVAGQTMPSKEIRRLWPVEEPRELDQDVPEGIRDRFMEGSRCENVGAYRGAAAMYRATIEELVKERGATGKTLYEKIEDLKSSLGDDLVTDLHEARMLGNDSVHDGLLYSAEEVGDVAELIIEMTEILYVQPARKAKMRQERQKRRAAAKTVATI